MKKFTTEEIRGLLNQVMREEISFSEMVEVINEWASEAEKPCIEDIPVRKFKKGDKVRIKHGVSSKTHHRISPCFLPEMDYLIGKKMTIESYLDQDTVLCEKLHWRFSEEWLEPHVEELKEGDLAIFWNDSKKYAVIRVYKQFRMGSPFPHQDYMKSRWENAVKFESKEQFEKLLKGEI